MTTGATEADAALFEALIVPNRSLSRRGIMVLSGAMLGATALLALRFWLIGAWPVAGFAIAEIALAFGLFRLHARRARRSELLLLSQAGLRIVRTDWRGRRSEHTLPTAWLRVQLEERPATVARLTVETRSTSIEIGSSLGDAEKRDLAEALHAALDRTRNPRFENPQLQG